MNYSELSIPYQLGKRIAFLRKEKGMSQLDLALEAGVSAPYLSSLERGKRNPTLEILTNIARALQVGLEELFRGIAEI